MGTKRKTRFTVNVGAKVAELFSVRDLGDNGLNITLPHSVNHEEPMRGDAPIQREYVSVHTSPASAESGTTIKRTTCLKDGRELTAVSFIKISKETLIWPVLFARLPDLRNERYAAKIRSKDTEVRLLDLDAERLSLLCAVFVTRNGVSIWYPPEFSAYSVVCYSFDLFTVWVYYSCVMIPSDHTGDQIIIVTSSPQTNNVPDFYMEKGGTCSYGQEDVQPMIIEAFKQLRIAQFERITTALPDLNEAQRVKLEVLCSNLVKKNKY